MYDGKDSTIDSVLGLTAEAGSWSFGGDVSRNFDTHAARSIPGYHEGHQLVASLSDAFLRHGSLCYELGCATGGLSRMVAERHMNKNVFVNGVDLEEDMVAKARARCADLPNVTILQGDITELSLDPCDLVISYYTVQFLSLSARLPLFEAVAKALKPGGAFVLFEKVRAEGSRIQDLNTHLYHAFKLANGFSASEVMAKSRSLLGVLEPLSSRENRALLTQAGLEEHSCIFRRLCFEGTISLKP
jgi:tRNA (cmo5U34)-methyltransferase